MAQNLKCLQGQEVAGMNEAGLRKTPGNEGDHDGLFEDLQIQPKTYILFWPNKKHLLDY